MKAELNYFHCLLHLPLSSSVCLLSTTHSFYHTLHWSFLVTQMEVIDMLRRNFHTNISSHQYHLVFNKMIHLTASAVVRISQLIIFCLHLIHLLHCIDCFAPQMHSILSTGPAVSVLCKDELA